MKSDRWGKGRSMPWAVALAVLVAACATPDERWRESGRALTADEGRARVARLLPDGVSDRTGWATDLYAAMAALQIPPTIENVCAPIAIIGQESGFQVDPVIPGLSRIARAEIERQRERAGIPKLVLRSEE